MGVEQTVNTWTNCSTVWTSITRFALVACGPLQLRSNVSERLLFTHHWLIMLVFAWVNWWHLLSVHCLHVVHVFEIANYVWLAERHLRHAITLVFNLIEFLTLLWPRDCSFRFFLFFLSCLELFIRAKQVNLPPFAFLRYGFWTLFQQMNCFALAFCTEQLNVFNKWSIVRCC